MIKALAWGLMSVPCGRHREEKAVKKKYMSFEGATARLPWGFGGAFLFVALSMFASDALAGDNVWTPTGPYKVYVVDAVAADPTNPQTVYATTLNSGIWKSADGGTSWLYLGKGLPGGYIRDVAVDPTNPQTLYVGTGNGVYKSANGGVSWTSASQGMPENTYVFFLAMDPSDPRTVYAETYNQGVFKRTDAGDSWTQIHPGRGNSSYKTLAIDPRNPRVLYFAAQKSDQSEQGIFKSTDAGASWTTVNRDIRGFSLTVDPVNTQNVYVNTLSDSVYKSTDGGVSWSVTLVQLDGQKEHVKSLVIDPTNARVLYALPSLNASYGVLKSVDGGGTWTRLTAGFPILRHIDKLAISASSPQILYAGIAFDGVYKSTDGGDTWTKLRWAAYPGYVFGRDPFRPRTLYVGMGGSLFETTDGGDSWTLKGITIGVQSFAIDPSSPQTLYVGGGDANGAAVEKITDRGLVRVNLGLPPNTAGSRQNVQILAVDPSNPQTLYAGLGWTSARKGGSGVYKTTDGGASWRDVGSGLPSSPRVNALTIDPSRTQTVYAGFDSTGVYRTMDGGASWTSVNAGIPANTTVRAFTFDPSQTQTLYAGTSGGVYKTADGGASWTLASAGLPPNTVANALAIDPFRPQTVYAGTSNGVYKTADGGASWTSFNAGLPVKSILTLVIDPSEQRLYAGANPGGVYVIQSADIGGRLLGDFDGSGEVNFDDFFLFAAAFGQKATGENMKFDLDGSGEVGLNDFFLFADRFGQKAQ